MEEDTCVGWQKIAWYKVGQMWWEILYKKRTKIIIFTLEQATKAQTGSRGIALLFP